MRLQILSFLIAEVSAFTSTTSTSIRHIPFSTPTPTLDHALLLIRQNNPVNQCPSSGNACANLAAPTICCPSQAYCAFDQVGNVACCPSGAACTGIIPSNTPSNPITGTFSPPGATSFVPNAFYPFAIIPTTYFNAEACSSSFSRCQTDFSSCTSALGAGGNAVTVNGGGGLGITGPVQGFLGPLSAASVCSSLSLQACYGLQLANCATYTAGQGATAMATAQSGFIAPNQAIGRIGMGGSGWKIGSWAVCVGFVVGVGMVGVRGLFG